MCTIKINTSAFASFLLPIHAWKNILLDLYFKNFINFTQIRNALSLLRSKMESLPLNRVVTTFYHVFNFFSSILKVYFGISYTYISLIIISYLYSIISVFFFTCTWYQCTALLVQLSTCVLYY